MLLESEELRFYEDMGMGSTARSALALPFTKISKRYDGYIVTQKEAKELKILKEAIDLVHLQANRGEVV